MRGDRAENIMPPAICISIIAQNNASRMPKICRARAVIALQASLDQVRVEVIDETYVARGGE